MLPTRDIAGNAANSAEHTTLAAAVQAAGLVQTLKGDGPFTVFAPVNDAFENLPEGHGADAAAAGEPGRAHEGPYTESENRVRDFLREAPR
jgi:hypothetical protein